MRRAVSWAAIAALALAVLVAGWLSPVRPASVRSDALGPDNGEQVTGYLERAAGSLRDTGGRPDTDHWALVSFASEAVVEEVAGLPGNPRIAQVLFRVPIPRVQTPLATVAVPQNRQALLAAPVVAAGRLAARAGNDRAGRVAAVSADRLRGGCACVVGVVVRAPLPVLATIEATDGVRAVEALPADAVAGRFSVTPLLPEHVEVVGPGPDDGQP